MYIESASHSHTQKNPWYRCLICFPHFAYFGARMEITWMIAMFGQCTSMLLLYRHVHTIVHWFYDMHFYSITSLKSFLTQRPTFSFLHFVEKANTWLLHGASEDDRTNNFRPETKVLALEEAWGRINHGHASDDSYYPTNVFLCSESKPPHQRIWKANAGLLFFDFTNALLGCLWYLWSLQGDKRSTLDSRSVLVSNRFERAWSGSGWALLESQATTRQ